MKVKMIKEMAGIRLYEAGRVYNVSPKQAVNWQRAGYCKPVVEEIETASVEPEKEQAVKPKRTRKPRTTKKPEGE